MSTLTQLREELSDPNANALFKYVSAIRTYRHALRGAPSEDSLKNKYDALILLSSASESYLTDSGSEVFASGTTVLPGLTKETTQLIGLVLGHPEKERLISGALSGEGAMDESLLDLIDEAVQEYTYHPDHL